ncbi:protection of telomeres protein 1-like isoform X2 [Branchiostoma lanceolatum]|uniref:protection of telomeres protein 1-like isoform X2 n=1 Tax=Branchiostoma lanceolatum TaxID=7740 RepID=UPI00345707AF
MSRIDEGAGPSSSNHGNSCHGNSGPGGHQTTTGRSYIYTKLSEVKVNTTVNILGAVKFFKPPFRSRGTDYCLVLKLVDPSVPTLEEGLKCLFFAKEESLLPQIRRVGDIVRILRLKVEDFRGAPQGKKGPGFSSLVFNGQLGAPTEPRADTDNYTFENQDEEKVLELRRWVSRTPELNGTTRRRLTRRRGQ